MAKMYHSKNASKSGWIILATLVFISGKAYAQLPTDPPELAELVGKAEAVRKETIDSPIAEKVASLNESYSVALQRPGLLYHDQIGDKPTERRRAFRSREEDQAYQCLAHH